MRIKRKTKIGKEKVYNMTIENVNCYPISKSNIIVHNCDALRYGVEYISRDPTRDRAFNIGW